MDNLRDWVDGRGFIAGEIGAVLILALSAVSMIAGWNNWQLSQPAEVIMVFGNYAGYALPGLLAAIWTKPDGYRDGAKLGALAGLSAGVIGAVVYLFGYALMLALFGGFHQWDAVLSAREGTPTPEEIPTQTYLLNVLLSMVMVSTTWVLFSSICATAYTAVSKGSKDFLTKKS